MYYKEFDYYGAENAQKRVLTYGWTLVAKDDAAGQTLVFSPNAQAGGDMPMQDLRILSGGTEKFLRMPYPCESVYVENGMIYAFSRDGHVMLAKLGSDDVRAYKLNLTIDRAYGVTGDGYAAIQMGETMYTVLIREDE
jgi:hypothetical protein